MIDTSKEIHLGLLRRAFPYELQAGKSCNIDISNKPKESWIANNIDLRDEIKEWLIRKYGVDYNDSGKFYIRSDSFMFKVTLFFVKKCDAIEFKLKFFKGTE